MTVGAENHSPNPGDPEFIAEVVRCIDAEKPVRRELADGGRIHIDRPLPYLCIHESQGEDTAARDVAVANSAYLLAGDLETATALISAVADTMTRHCGAFLIVQVAELSRDRPLAADSPYLPPFEIKLEATTDLPAQAAAEAFANAVQSVEAKYRTPRIVQEAACPIPGLQLPHIAIRFAPIYRQPNSRDDYHDLRERVVANLYDAALRGVCAFLEVATGSAPSTHRSFGRRVYVDTVERVDRMIDEICGAFDFLLSVTPINSDIAWREFRDGGFDHMPRLLYRPIGVRVEELKRKLFAIPFDNLEDPVLERLYREKQIELDLQLTMLGLRETTKFREASRVLYGPVELALHNDAVSILTKLRGRDDSDAASVGSTELAQSAERMIDAYRGEYDGFLARVEIRDDLPAGMMVSGDCLMISRQTRMSKRRVQALLSHEIGVHLLTYFTGDAQGLRLFRSGLAGHEGVQEGLAVFAEYLAGGLTRARLRIIAARVIGCGAMLDGAELPETHRLLVEDYGLSPAGAFNLTLRLYRSGGFAKDAIYLRGLIEILDHLGSGGSLEPFLVGKIASAHLAVIGELSARGLLRAPPVRPSFFKLPGAQQRLEAAGRGLSPADLLLH